MKSLLSWALLPSTDCASAVPLTKAAKESLSSTMPATARAVWVPDSIATATSAARSARTSLAPSPTIATKCLLSRRAVTMRAFCSGAMRPNTLWRSTASWKAASSRAASSAPEMWPPGSSMPSCRTSASTVAGLSPLMIFGSMPISSINWKASATSSRSTSATVTRARARTSRKPVSGSGSATASAKMSPRRPMRAASA